MAIAGEDAARVAESLARQGAPPLVVEGQHFALLSIDPDPPTPARVRDLAPESVDAVVLRRAWKTVLDVGASIASACKAVAPGGEVVAADLGVERLLAGPTPRYPVRLFYLGAPEAAANLRVSTAPATLLGLEAIRAGLCDVEGITYDDVLGEYESVADLWEAIRARGWGGANGIPSTQLHRLYEEVARPLARAIPTGGAVDREPWYAVVGTRRRVSR